MKKLAAILLIALFLFNLFGYQFLFNYAQQVADVQLEASLDNDEYNEADLLTIKIALNLPYLNQQQDFERVNGEINVNGKIYKYVKRKVSNGELVLQCLPDYNKMKLQNGRNDFFKYTNDIVPQNNSKKSNHAKTIVIKKLSFEWYPSGYSQSSNNITILQSCNREHLHTNLPSSPGTSPDQPPEVYLS